MRLGRPEDQSFQPDPSQVIGHLAGRILLAGDAQQINNECPEIAIVETVDQIDEIESTPIVVP